MMNRTSVLIPLVLLCLAGCSMVKSRWYFEPRDETRLDERPDYPAAVVIAGTPRVLIQAVGSQFEIEAYGPCLIPLVGRTPTWLPRRRLNLLITISQPGKPVRITPADFRVITDKGEYRPRIFQILDDGGFVPSSRWATAYYDRKEFAFQAGRIRLFYDLDTRVTKSFRLIAHGIQSSEHPAAPPFLFEYDRRWKYIPFTLKPMRALGGAALVR